MPKGTTLREMVETRSYSKKLFFMVKFPEFLGSHTYMQHSIQTEECSLQHNDHLTKEHGC